MQGFVGHGCKYSFTLRNWVAFSVRNSLKHGIAHNNPDFWWFLHNHHKMCPRMVAWSVKKLRYRVCDHSDRFSVQSVTVATVIAWENIHLTPAREFTRLKSAFSPHADLNPLVSQWTVISIERLFAQASHYFSISFAFHVRIINSSFCSAVLFQKLKMKKSSSKK